MKPRFAVLRKGVEPLTMDRLERAFGKAPGLTPADAGILCKDALGILVRNFEAVQATALQAGLKAEGVEVEVVEESRMPVLPTGKMIRRLECKPEGLTVFDSIGWKASVAWGDVMLIAAGRVKQATFPRTRAEGDEVRTESIHISAHGMPVKVRPEFEYTSRESAEWFLRIEIMLAGGVERYSIEGGNFDFACLGERASKSLAHNFCLLVRELVRFAPHAVLNSGASSIIAGPGEVVAYPRKNVLEDEIVWMLWWAAKQQS